MARIRKRKHRKVFNLGAFASVLFTLSLLCALACSLFVGSINASLTIEIQKMNLEIDELKLDNQKLNIDIQTLQNKERVFVIAQDAGLSQDQRNIISVKDAD